MVALIEGWLVPGGFSVETRRPVYNDRGHQVAELDIVITGRIGTSSYRALIECRDRPSEGPAPVSWIEQLVGRRQRFAFKSVMAVSTTGFALGAKEYAASVGIELRNLEDLDYEVVADWLPKFAPLCINHGELNAVKIHLRGLEDSVGQEPQLGKFQIDEQRFVDRLSGQSVSLMDIWRQIVNAPETFDGINVFGVPYKVRIQTSSDLNDRYLVRAEGLELHIDRIEIEATLKIEPSTMPLVRAARYLSQPIPPGNEQVYVNLGHWKGNDDDIVKEMIILAIPKDGSSDTG